MFKLFLFAANNSNVEWSLRGYKHTGGFKEYTISTYNVDFKAPSSKEVFKNEGFESFDIHSHAKINNLYGGSPGDENFYKNKMERLSNLGISMPYHGVYEKENQKFYNYTNKGSSFIRHIGSNYKRFYFGAF